MYYTEALVVLGFSPESKPSSKDIRRAYRALALQNHPDRGGDHHKMVEINTAFDLLAGKRRESRKPVPRPQQRRQEAKPAPRQTQEQAKQAAANRQAAENLKKAADRKAAADLELATHRQGRSCPFCGQPQFCLDCRICFICYFSGLTRER